MDDAASIIGSELAGGPRPSSQSLMCLVLSRHEFDLYDDWSAAKYSLLEELGISSADLDQISDTGEHGVTLLGAENLDIGELPNHISPPSPVQYQTSYPTSPALSSTVPHSDFSVVVDERLEVMLRRAVTSYPCILLVGPPGTGKGALLRWLIQSVAEDPSSFGFNHGLDPNPVWRTPDESWSSFELIGGFVPDAEGRLESCHGLVPTVLQEGRWLILDETNRAEMDKIMGPLLTWLSDQEVEIGRTMPNGGAPILLGWTDASLCRTDDASSDEREVRLLAGRDWRLVGTYNPQDVQRVFRFGQALARRFVVVPIPTISPGQLEHLLSTRYSFLPTDALVIIADLYRQHRDSKTTILGPAVFLRMADYIATADADAVLEDVVAEAYAISLGRYLASYEDTTFDDLGERILAGTELTAADWAWIKTQREILS